MLKSRALPDDFDMTRVLHHPFSTRSATEMSFRSPRSYPAPYGTGEMLKPLAVNGIKRDGEDEYVPSPASTTSYGNYTPSPTSCPPSENLSSTATNQTAIPTSKPTLHSVNHSNVSTLARSHSLSGRHPHSWQSISGIHSQDPGGRTRAESLGARHQTSMSYPGSTFHSALPRSSDGMVFNYENLPLLQDPIPPAESENSRTTAFAPTYQSTLPISPSLFMRKEPVH
jgi:hypothetical protein